MLKKHDSVLSASSAPRALSSMRAWRPATVARLRQLSHCGPPPHSAPTAEIPVFATDRIPLVPGAFRRAFCIRAGSRSWWRSAVTSAVATRSPTRENPRIVSISPNISGRSSLMRDSLLTGDSTSCSTTIRSYGGAPANGNGSETEMLHDRSSELRDARSSQTWDSASPMSSVACVRPNEAVSNALKISQSASDLKVPIWSGLRIQRALNCDVNLKLKEVFLSGIRAEPGRLLRSPSRRLRGSPQF
jgi:hypothetical protein